MKKGDRVKLSAEGLTLFREWRGQRPADRRGTITNTCSEAPNMIDGCVRVLWDGLKHPQTYGESFLEVIGMGESGPGSVV